MHYTVTQLKDPGRPNNLQALADLQAAAPAMEDQGIRCFGLFAPLFGLASNECYAVTFSDTPRQIDEIAGKLNLTVLSTHHLTPTARPTAHVAREKPGIYVFRWFRVAPENTDEIVRLSEQAWVTFEGGFDTEVQALLRETAPTGDVSTMLLITQYDDLSVWEASRQPAPEARENFRARAALTLDATPIATRLVLPN